MQKLNDSLTELRRSLETLSSLEKDLMYLASSLSSCFAPQNPLAYISNKLVADFGSRLVNLWRPYWTMSGIVKDMDSQTNPENGASKGEDLGEERPKETLPLQSVSVHPASRLSSQGIQVADSVASFWLNHQGLLNRKKARLVKSIAKQLGINLAKPKAKRKRSKSSPR